MPIGHDPIDLCVTADAYNASAGWLGGTPPQPRGVTWLSARRAAQIGRKAHVQRKRKVGGGAKLGEEESGEWRGARGRFEVGGDAELGDETAENTLEVVLREGKGVSESRSEPTKSTQPGDPRASRPHYV